MANKYLDDNGLLYFWQKIKAAFISNIDWDSTNRKITKTKNGSTSDVVTFSKVATSGSYSDLSNKPTIPTVPSVYGGDPLMDGIASAGSSPKWAAGDHRHPTDTSRAPTNHASTATTYGGATDEYYGHVKLSDSTSSTSAATNGRTAATPKAVKDALANAVGQIPAPQTNTNPQMDGTADHGSSALYSRADHVHPTDTSRAPVNHASTATTYGTASDTNYGHIRLSDSTTSESNTTGGRAATPKAVYDALAAAKTYAAQIAGDANQYAYSNVKVGNSTISADSTTDTLELVAGANVTLTPDTTYDKVTIAAASPDLSGYVQTSSVGAADGICPLNSSSKIDSAYLPSYVDDVIEAYPISGQTELSAGWLSATSGGAALTPEAGKIYVILADSTTYAANTQFRWGGSAYVKLADGGVSSITNAEIDAIAV